MIFLFGDRLQRPVFLLRRLRCDAPFYWIKSIVLFCYVWHNQRSKFGRVWSNPVLRHRVRSRDVQSAQRYGIYDGKKVLLFTRVAFCKHWV